MKKFYNILLFFITLAYCACANETEMIGKNFTKWQCLSIDTQDKSAVANLNKDIILDKFFKVNRDGVPPPRYNVFKSSFL